MNASTSDLASLHATIFGHVQGVYFRAFVEEHAHALKVTGWVRNIRGQPAVEVEAEGDRSALERLLAQLHQGPPGSRVDRIEVNWDEHAGRFSDFRITF